MEIILIVDTTKASGPILVDYIKYTVVRVVNVASNLEDSHSHSQILRGFENEGSVWLPESARVTLEFS